MQALGEVLLARSSGYHGDHGGARDLASGIRGSPRSGQQTSRYSLTAVLGLALEQEGHCRGRQTAGTQLQLPGVKSAKRRLSRQAVGGPNALQFGSQEAAKYAGQDNVLRRHLCLKYPSDAPCPSPAFLLSPTEAHISPTSFCHLRHHQERSRVCLRRSHTPLPAHLPTKRVGSSDITFLATALILPVGSVAFICHGSLARSASRCPTVWASESGYVAPSGQ